MQPEGAKEVATPTTPTTTSSTTTSSTTPTTSSSSSTTSTTSSTSSTPQTTTSTTSDVEDINKRCGIDSKAIPDASQICSVIVSHLPAEANASAAGGFINFSIALAEESQQQQQQQQPATESKELKKEKQQKTNKKNKDKEKSKDEDKDISMDTGEDKSAPAHKLEIRMVPSEFIQEEYDIYYKYQTTVHHDKPDKVTPDGYTITQRVKGDVNKGIPECGYGSFHQQYILDGKIIAVGVVDVLPSCLSSVYFFYDPALREIQWVQQAMKTSPQLKYYYLGFYIHSCAKMRYKGQYKPSDLLCPENYEWVPLSEAIPKLEKTKYTRLVDKLPTPLSKEERQQIIEKIPILYQNRVMKYSDFNSSGKKYLLPRLLEYIPLVGPKLAQEMLFHVN